MNKRFACILLYVCMLLISANGQSSLVSFGEEAESEYGHAVKLNEEKNYLEAYPRIVSAENKYDLKLVDMGIQAKALPLIALNDYCAMKRTKAEIANALGIHSDMNIVSKELWGIIRARQWEGEEEQYVKNNLMADVYKIDASRYYLMEELDSAKVALDSVLIVSQDWLNSEFNFFYAVREDYAQLYYKKEEYGKALAQLDTILMHDKFKHNQRVLQIDKIPERRNEVQSQRAICMARLGRYDEALKEIAPVVQYFKKANDKRLYAEALRKKAKILMLQYDATGKYNPEAVTCYLQYLAISRDYIDNHFVQMSESHREQYWMAEQPFVTDCFRLEDKAPELLYDVALYSKAVLLRMGRDFKAGMTAAEKRKALASIRVKWQDVRDKLPSDGCAIEFIVYEKQGKNHIGALVVNKESAGPKFIDIGNIAAIRDYSLAAAFDVKKVLKDTRNDSEIFWLYNDDGLNSLIWNSQLISAIGGCKQVFFSPDGIFHQLAIEYMAPEELKGKKIFRLTTTRLLAYPRERIRTDNMLICSGIDYRSSVNDNEMGNDALAYSLLTEMGDVKLSPLVFSEREADSIMGIRYGHNYDKVLRADSVTEATLHKLLGKYNIVHISTHGLFTELSKSGTDIRPSSSDTQLSKSCLFLSGSEQKLLQPDFDASRHDGIMSARELAKLDMHHVCLTVLSACMSGLGYVTSDGVFGLQRGLKTAGVKAIISSLWEIDDEASSYFILCLYDGLESGLNLHDAFYAAREALRNTDKPDAEMVATSGSFMQRWKNIRYSARNFNKPYFYNAFILIDGLE